MTIDQLYKFVQFIANKDQTGNNPSPDEFNLAVSRAFIEWVNDNYSNKQKYIPGQNIPVVGYQKNQAISDDLRFLIETREFSVPSTGLLKIPNGTTVDIDGLTASKYMHLSSARSKFVYQCEGKYLQKEVPVQFVRDDELANMLKSRIVKPKKDFPIMCLYNASTSTFSDQYFQFYPKNINRVTLTYLKEPKAPVWGYTTNTGVPVYNPSTSVDLQSPDHTHNDIAIRVLRYLGIHIREPQMFQAVDYLKKEGI